MKSVWSIETNQSDFDRIKGDIKTDVLVIGGGITGLLCGFMLKQSGVNCIVAEANKICSGITKNTTAKITCQHGLIYNKMIDKFGVKTARLYFEAQIEAFEMYKKLCWNIECDFNECSSFVYSTSDRKKLEKEVNALNKIGCKAVFQEKVPLTLSTVGAVRVDNQAQFNPLKFLFSIAKDIPIFENTKILKIEDKCVITNSGKIEANKIIVATHFPFINMYGGYFLKMYQQRSYVIAFKNVPIIKGMYIDEAENGLSFRSYKDMLLIGGGGHRTGKNGGGWDELSRFAKKYYPNAEEVTRWATQDCMTLDNIPYIGQYSPRTPNLFVATGFNKWGMTSAMVSAIILKDLVCGMKNEYEEIFSPGRSSIHPQLIRNIGSSLIGILTPTVPRCPHLGCALKYNPQEHSWDCPCHGSRFTESGELIDNPAKKDKNSENRL